LVAEDQDRDFKRLHSVRAVNGPTFTYSQKDGVEANVGGSSVRMLTKRAVLLVGGFDLAPKSGIFTILDFHKMDVPLIGYELKRVPDPR